MELQKMRNKTARSRHKTENGIEQKTKKKRRENCDGRHSISKWHQQQENNNTKKNCSTSTKEQKTSSIYATHCQCAFIGTMAIRWFVQGRKKKNFEKMLFAEKIVEKLYFATFPVCFGCSFQNESFVFNNEKYFSLAFHFDSDYVNVCRRVIMYFAVIVTIVKFYLSKLVCM